MTERLILTECNIRADIAAYIGLIGLFCACIAYAIECILRLSALTDFCIDTSDRAMAFIRVFVSCLRVAYTEYDCSFVHARLYILPCLHIGRTVVYD